MADQGALLLVDDDRDQLELMAAELRSAGWHVIAVDCVASAREAWARRTFDVAVIDGVLPDGDGLDLFDELRRAAPAIRALLITSETRRAKIEAEAPGRVGAGDVLYKPFSPEALVLRISSLRSGPALTPIGNPPAALALEALRAGYRDRLGAKLDELQAALDAAHRGEPDAPERALRLAHKLHGTAGSYGFAAVSSAAGAIESELAAQRESGRAPHWPGVTQAMRAARAGAQ